MMFDYNTLTTLGDTVALNLTINNPKKIINEIEATYEFKKYNLRKHYNRYGLSLTSIDGKLKGSDLDSLQQLNFEKGLSLGEMDFKVKTPVYSYFENVLKPFDPYIGRTHIIRIDQGGFFPPHRDVGIKLNTFRLLMNIQNASELPSSPFIIDDNIKILDRGRLYFVDTVKVHHSFNMGTKPSYWLVANVYLCEESIKAIYNNLLCF